MGSYNQSPAALTRRCQNLSLPSQDSLKVLGLPSPPSYFLSDHSKAVLRDGPYLTFKTGGWEADSKRWGLVWSSDRSQNSLPGIRMKQVRVITKSGESLLANTFQ